MSFRKRNVVIPTPGHTSSLQSVIAQKILQIPGVRPSPLDGRLTISTGTRSLDTLLAGHAGLALGNSILIEENGTTEFGGALLRYYAAEGALQGHQIHVLGMNDSWGRELPGLMEKNTSSGKGERIDSSTNDKMKIAWRYERLGEFGASARGARSPIVYSSIYHANLGLFFSSQIAIRLLQHQVQLIQLSSVMTLI